ncbi:MAG: polymerase [Candidatus Parcubacteria bacterium]|jgi:DNA polymerase-1
MTKAVWDLKSQFVTYKEGDVFDCMVAEFLLSDGRYVPSVEEVLKKYGVTTLDDLVVKQKERFEKLPKLYSLFTDIEMPLIPVLSQMEKEGITLDTESLKKVGDEIENAIHTSEDEIKKEVGFDINLNSSVQVGNYLAEKAMVPLKKTKTGRYATNENELTQFADQFPVIKQLLVYRELSKLRSTYVESLIGKVDASGRIHTSYNQVAVNTGRLSSSNPNLQNIPVTSDLGQKIKSCFVASPGHIFVSFDYSQQELRILAHLTGEEKLIQAFREKRDVHTTTAAQIFSVPYESVTKEQRSAAKTINFGIVYGMSKYGLSTALQIPEDAAATFIDAFFANYPKIKTYYDAYLADGKKNGYVETILGRRRYVFEYPGQKFIDNNMRRVLINYPIQGSAAELIKKAMVQIRKEILDKDSSQKLLLQIHDDLVFEIEDFSGKDSGHKKKSEEFIASIRKIMCEVYPLAVPIEVDVKIGKNWGEMEKISS